MSTPEPPAEQTPAEPAGAAGAAERAEEEIEQEISSLRALFRERRLSLRTMERPLRLATGGAFASLIGVILLIALRDVRASDIVLGRSGGVVLEISQPVFIATLVLVSIGFAYIMTAAVLASWQVALPALLVLTAVIGVEAGAFGSLVASSGFVTILPGWAQWVTRGLIAAVWLLPAAVWLFEARASRRGQNRQMRLAVLGAYTMIFGSYFTVLAVASPHIGGLNLFPQVIGLVMGDLVLLVTPILQVAAVDFGEWGGLLGERVAAAGHGSRGRWLTVLAVALSASLVVYGYAKVTATVPELSVRRLWSVGRTTILLAVALIVVVVLGRALGAHRRRWPATLNFAAIFAVCAMGTYLLTPLIGYSIGAFSALRAPVEQVTPTGQYTSAADVVSVHGGSGPTRFSMLIPRGWLASGVGAAGIWTSYAVPGPKPGTLVLGFERVAVVTFPLIADAGAFARYVGMTATGPQTRAGAWTRVPVTLQGGAELLWTRPMPDPSQPGTFVVTDFIKGAPLAVVQPLFEAVVNSFRTAGQPAATLPAGERAVSDATAQQAHDDRVHSMDIAISGCLLLVLLIAVAAGGRRWPPRLVGTIFLFGMVTLATLLFFANSLGRTLLGAHARWPYVGEFGLLAGIGVLALIALAVTAGKSPAYRRRLAVGLIALGTTIWTLQGMSVLYDHALQASRISAWAAIIVLVAIAWDVTMSGESLTNHGSRHAPRATRVLAFFGYVILVAATVLFYSAQRTVATGRAAEAMFEPEAITQAALFRIAFPLAVLLFLLRFARGSTAPAVVADPGAPDRPMSSEEPESGSPQDSLVASS